ncbi:MAG: YraN family protein [Candidatus Binatia bacterium]
MQAGFVILARNYRCACGEIDLVALERRTLVFVEVKARHGAAAGARSTSSRRASNIASSAPRNASPATAWASGESASTSSGYGWRTIRRVASWCAGRSRAPRTDPGGARPALSPGSPACYPDACSTSGSSANGRTR